MALTLMGYHMEKECSVQKTRSILVNGIKGRKYLTISIIKAWNWMVSRDSFRLLSRAMGKWKMFWTLHLY